MTAYLVTILLFVLCLIVIPIGISPFEVPKVILAEIAIEILLLFQITRFKKVSLKRLNIHSLLVIILLILSIDQILLFHPGEAFFGNVFRMQGVFLFWHLLIFSIISKDIAIDQAKKVILPVSFICLFMGALILGVDENKRAFGTLGEPNALAATALFFFPFLFLTYRKITKTLVFLSTLSISLLSGSKAGLLALVIQLGFIFLVKILKFSTPKAIIISIILICLSLFLPFAQNSDWFENRSLIWQTALEAGKASPVIGAGFGNIQNPIHQAALKLGNPVQYQMVDSSHNFLLDFWVQGGLVGVISILFLISFALAGLKRQKRIVETTALLGVTTAMLFNPVSVVNLLAFWWLIGQGFSGGGGV